MTLQSSSLFFFFFHYHFVRERRKSLCAKRALPSFILFFTSSPFLSFSLSPSRLVPCISLPDFPFSLRSRLTYKSVSDDRRRGRYGVSPLADRASPLPLPYRTFRQIHHLVFPASLRHNAPSACTRSSDIATYPAGTSR